MTMSDDDCGRKREEKPDKTISICGFAVSSRFGDSRVVIWRRRLRNQVNWQTAADSELMYTRHTQVMATRVFPLCDSLITMLVSTI